VKQSKKKSKAKKVAKPAKKKAKPAKATKAKAKGATKKSKKAKSATVKKVTKAKTAKTVSGPTELAIDPYASLNPGFRIGRSVRRPLEIHKIHRSRAERDAAVKRLLEQVKLTPPDLFAGKFPHELSGGQRQRVAIARSLAVGPKVLLADEPVSMLDVSVKVEILNVLNECREKLGLALLYVTHDIASARWCADTISVMYAGQIVESGPTEEVTQRARHPYTQLLIRSTPDPAATQDATGDERPGGRAETAAPNWAGCRFSNSCPSAMARCATAEPPTVQLAPDQWVRCWLYAEPDPASGDRRTPDGSAG
jgi:peptide/nickel transport system ATP-binding protein